VKSCVSLLGGRVDLGASGQQLTHNLHVALLGCQMQSVEAILEGERSKYMERSALKGQKYYKRRLLNAK